MFDAHGYMYTCVYIQVTTRATRSRREAARWRRQASSAEIDNPVEKGDKGRRAEGGGGENRYTYAERNSGGGGERVDGERTAKKGKRR